MARQELAHGLAHLAGALAVNYSQSRPTSAKPVVDELSYPGNRLVEGLAAHLDLLRHELRRSREGGLDRRMRSAAVDADHLADRHAGAQAPEADLDVAVTV